MGIVFGPITSRRFGISLGVDVSPHKKQCNFDCVYCELGSPKPPHKKTYANFDEIVSLDLLIYSVKTALQTHQNIDVLTITANGEPTLYPHLEEFITEIKPFIPPRAKSLILSNGSRFGDKSVQNALKHFDIVKFSLDSLLAKSFKKVDRPHKSIDLEALKKGIESYARIRENMLVCEILLVKNANDSAEDLEALAAFLRAIRVDRIDLGTIDRPPAYNVKPLSHEDLCAAREFFSDLFVSLPQRGDSGIAKKLELTKPEILDLIAKRPLEKGESAIILSPQSLAFLLDLLRENQVKIKKMGAIDFYVL